MSLFTNPDFGTNRTSWPGEILSDPKTWVDSWGESSNIFAQGSYSMANSFSIVGQSLNPFDGQATSLTGANLSGMDNSGYGAEVAGSLLPLAGSTGIKYSTQALKSALLKTPTKNQVFNLFKGQFRLENGIESVRRSVQTANGIRLVGPAQKPYHFYIRGTEIPVNWFNPLWRLH